MTLPELDVLTLIDPCAYSNHGGLNETFVLTTVDGKSVAGLHYENIDLEYIASKERNAKKKRLMLTPDFTSWKSKVLIRQNNRDKVAPVFHDSAKSYNSLGGER